VLLIFPVSLVLGEYGGGDGGGGEGGGIGGGVCATKADALISITAATSVVWLPSTTARMILSKIKRKSTVQQQHLWSSSHAGAPNP